jgi:adenosylcobinamide hydrolase
VAYIARPAYDQREFAVVRLSSMLVPIPIPGLTIHEKPEAVHVKSREMLTTLSSSFFGGGFKRVHHILNAKVDQDYCSDAPAADLRAIAARCGVTDPFVGLLTAVPLRKARFAFCEETGLRAGALITAGVGNATSAGVSLPCEPKPGTINIILILDAKLTRSAMVNAIVTATEAKSAILNEMGIRTPDGGLATGTSTDTVTVAMTGLGPTQPYAGPATVLGWLIAKTVRQALQESLLAM